VGIARHRRARRRRARRGVRGSPFLETLPPDACVVVDDIAAAADALRAIHDNPATFLERGRARRANSRA